MTTSPRTPTSGQTHHSASNAQKGPSPASTSVPHSPARRAPGRPASSGRIPIAEADRVLISITTTSGSDALEYTHRFVSDYARSHFRPSVAQSISVAAYELIANAITYGSVSGEVLFELLKGVGSVALRVSNDTIQARLAMFSSLVERLQVNAEATFVEEMRRSMGGGARPMLGLARIVHEAGLDLSYSVADRRLTIVARCWV